MVKQNKLKLIVSNADGTTEKDFKSYKDIANFLNIEYHQARGLHMLSETPKKFLHSNLKLLSSKFKIVSIKPNYSELCFT